MDKHNSPTRSHLFTVRLWTEEPVESGSRWYGKLQDMADGRTAYFEDLQALLALLQSLLVEEAATPVQVSPPGARSGADPGRE